MRKILFTFIFIISLVSVYSADLVEQIQKEPEQVSVGSIVWDYVKYPLLIVIIILILAFILYKFFSNLMPTCSLEESAPLIGWGVLEIIPDDPSTPGIIAEVSTVLSKENISIRQAIGNDYALSNEPKLYIITEEPVPPNLIKRIKKC